MNAQDKEILEKYKSMLMKEEGLYKLILFGSRARGEAAPSSDMDVVVIWEKEADEHTREYISNCAWEAGFERGLIIVPIIFTKEEWTKGPERNSLLVQAVEKEGLPV